MLQKKKNSPDNVKTLLTGSTQSVLLRELLNNASWVPKHQSLWQAPQALPLVAQMGQQLKAGSVKLSPSLLSNNPVTLNLCGAQRWDTLARGVTPMG